MQETNNIDLDKLVSSAGNAIAQHYGAGPLNFSYEVDLSDDGEVLIHTDIAQRVAGVTRTPEGEVAARSEEIFKSNTDSNTQRYLKCVINDRFLNFAASEVCAAERVTFISTQSLPKRIFAIRPPLAHHGRVRLAARLSVQIMANAIIDKNARPELFTGTPEELEEIALSQLPRAVALNSELSTVWIFPQSAPKDTLSRTLRGLGLRERALVESIASDEWGPIDGLVGFAGPDGPAGFGELNLGQRLALAEFSLLGELDLVGSGRNEVRNLPWLMSTIVERMTTIFPHGPVLHGISADGASMATSGKHFNEGDSNERESKVLGGRGISERWLFRDIMRNLSMREVVLRGAARGRVCAYLNFWRNIARSTLKIINDPTFRRDFSQLKNISKTELACDDISCSYMLMSVLSETVATWENHLHNELTLP